MHDLRFHVVDTRIRPGLVRRRIGNYIRYRNDAGVFVPTSVAAEATDGAPPEWSDGSFGFRRQIRTAPLECFVDDAGEATNRAAVALRVNHHRAAGVRVVAIGSNASGAVALNPRTDVWPDLLPQTDYYSTHGGHQWAQRWRLKAPGHPAQFSVVYRAAPGCTVHLVGETVEVRQLGEVRLRTRPPWGQGANGEPVRVALVVEDAPPHRQWLRVAVVPNADDLAAATYRADIDPMVTLDDTVIEDMHMIKSVPTFNYGGATQSTIGYFNASITWRSMLRVTGGVPDNLTAARLFWWQYTVSGSTAKVAEAWRVAEANAAWNAGTANGAAQENSGSWGYLSWSATTPVEWAGGPNGCGIVGTDIIAESGPQPSVPLFPSLNNYHQFDLPPGWDWTGGGILVKVDTEAAPSANASFRSTESSFTEERPYFEFDYEEGGGFAPLLPLLQPRLVG